MAFVFRGEIPDEETKMRATQRLYLLLPNHKCPSKECPFHPPEDATEEEGDLLIKPQSQPLNEVTTDPIEETVLSDYDSVVTVDSGVGKEREDWSDGGDVVKSPSPPCPEPHLQDIEEDDEGMTFTPESLTLEDSTEHDADDERATPVLLTPPEEEQEIKEDTDKDRNIPDPPSTVWSGPRVPTTRPDDYKLQVAPEFTGKLKDKRVVSGLSLHLHCSVTGLPEPHVRWLKDGQEIHNGPLFNIKNNYGLLTLEVASVGAEHGGVYTCEAVNDKGTVSCHATVTVQGEEAVKQIKVEILRPRFLMGLCDQVVLEGDDVTLTCLATGNPMPQFTWQKDMLEVTPSPRVQLSTDGEGGATLTIAGVRASDSGLYLVRAKSRSGRCQSTASLRVQGGSGSQGPRPRSHSLHGFSSSLQPKMKVDTPPSFSLLLPPSLDVHEGESLRLDCSVRGYPPPLVSWYKNHRELVYSQRHRIMFVGSLHTLQIPQAMALDSGHYIVRAVNSSGSVHAACTVSILPASGTRGDVTSRPPRHTFSASKIKTAPFFTKTLPTSMEVSEGDNFRLDCILRQGIQLVPWSRDRQIDQSQLERDNQASNSPEGGPSKEPEPTEGMSRQTQACSLQFLEELPGEVVVKVGESVTLSCTVSHAFTRVTWYKEDRRLSFLSERISSVTEEGGRVSLRMSDARSSDAGGYRCVATLSDGSAIETSTLLSVHGESEMNSETGTGKGDGPPPPTLQSPLLDMNVVIGDRDVKLQCEVSEGQEVTWYHEGQEVVVGSQYRCVWTGTTASLTIRQIRHRDSGQYQCVIGNPGGQVTTTCTLSTREPDKLEAPYFVRELHDMEVEDGDKVELVVEVEDTGPDTTAEI